MTKEKMADKQKYTAENIAIEVDMIIMSRTTPTISATAESLFIIMPYTAPLCRIADIFA